mgnify:CR=1 FL=1
MILSDTMESYNETGEIFFNEWHNLLTPCVKMCWQWNTIGDTKCVMLSKDTQHKKKFIKQYAMSHMTHVAKMNHIDDHLSEVLYKELPRKFHMNMHVDDQRDLCGVTNLVCDFIQKILEKEFKHLDLNDVPYCETRVLLNQTLNESKSVNARIIFPNMIFENKDCLKTWKNIVDFHLVSGQIPLSETQIKVIQECWDSIEYKNIFVRQYREPKIYKNNQLYRLPFQSDISDGSAFIPISRMDDISEYLIGVYDLPSKHHPYIIDAYSLKKRTLDISKKKKNWRDYQLFKSYYEKNNLPIGRDKEYVNDIDLDKYS